MTFSTEDAETIKARYPDSRSALLPLLHLVQSVEGYVSPAGIAFCAEQLGITKAEVGAVATFYTMYKRKPAGRHHVGVCTNTLCAVLGGDEILKRVEEHTGLHHGQTSEDGAISVEHLECNAACDYAPVVMVNWEFFDNQTPQSTCDLIDRLRAGETVAPTRGPSSTPDWKDTERLLAGFYDGRAGEGVQAGPETLVGLGIARDKGHAAAPLPDGSTV